MFDKYISFLFIHCLILSHFINFIQLSSTSFCPYFSISNCWVNLFQIFSLSLSIHVGCGSCHLSPEEVKRSGDSAADLGADLFFSCQSRWAVTSFSTPLCGFSLCISGDFHPLFFFNLPACGFSEILCVSSSENRVLCLIAFGLGLQRMGV